MHSGDLNNELVRLVDIQIMEICSIVEWFAIQMPVKMSVHYSDHYLVNGPDWYSNHYSGDLKSDHLKS